MKYKDNEKEYQRIWQQNWRKEHSEKALIQRRISMKKWRKKHPEEHNDRNKKFRDKWKGIPESKLQEKIKKEMNLYSLDENHPDFYDTKLGCFIEIKRALPFKKCSWAATSKYFPNLYFFRVRKCVHTASIDEQIEKYPKPLLVIIFNALTGEELIRKNFGVKL